MRALVIGEVLGVEVLKAKGFEVTGAATLKQALKALDGTCFDLVIADEIEAKLLEALSASPKHEEIIAESSAMQKVLLQAETVAKSGASVFLTGESGTGKEVVAGIIHRLSGRTGPYVRVNCAAIPETLIESEFFGHEKGSFTGAVARRLGRFERAHKGTLLLDEVTEMPHSLQAKLLRAVQEMEFERVGGGNPVSVDVRLIATSNRDMEEALGKNMLRADLFYRLNVIPLHIPPLRERSEDILPLAKSFLAGRKSLSAKEKKVLQEHSWPGNVRELANVMERAAVLGELALDTDLLPIDALENRVSKLLPR